MRKKKTVFIIISMAVIIFILGMATLFGYHNIIRPQLTKKFGTNIKPTENFPLKDIVYYLQDDPLWSEDKIGGTDKKMSSHGCLISCVAASISHLGITTDPKEVNERLIANEGYDGADLIWYKIKEAFPGIDYRYKNSFTEDDINHDLKNGFLPIVKVKYKGRFVYHWVLIIGAQEGEYFVYDPLEKSKKPILLSTHGKTYSYRVLYKES